MSKKIEATIQCPKCGNKFPTKLFRSIWVEEPSNLSLILRDEINVVVCPSCGEITKLEFPFLCTNVKQKFALWYEPYHDSAIDKDVLQYSSQFGPNSFYAKAPRIQSWEMFKGKLIELDASTKQNRGNPSPSNTSVGGSAKTVVLSDFPALSTNFQYPRWLSHLKFPSKRLKYATFPFWAFFIFIFFATQDSLLSLFDDMWRHLGQVILMFLAFGATSYLILTIIHLSISEFKPWRERSKQFRIYCFASGCWILGALLSAPFIADYSYRFGSDDLIQLLSVLFAPPIFLGGAMYIYRKYI